MDSYEFMMNGRFGIMNYYNSYVRAVFGKATVGQSINGNRKRVKIYGRIQFN
ncbi:MAG: hypothetical protein ACOX5F_08985 [Anaerovoracaceae bacterium]|jgi:hypothetical protein